MLPEAISKSQLSVIAEVLHVSQSAVGGAEKRPYDRDAQFMFTDRPPRLSSFFCSNKILPFKW